MVTGGNSGVGFHLCQILYNAGGIVYMASRSEKLAKEAIEQIEVTSLSTKKGEIHYLHIDLADLNSVKQCAAAFKQQRRTLDVLWNNAGISRPAYGSVSAQGHELTIAVNCLGSFLLTQLLLPELKKAAQESQNDNSVRVIFTSSLLVDQMSPPGGVDMKIIDTPPTTSGGSDAQYCMSKAGNYFLTSEFAKRYTSSTGIVALTQNPGNLKTRVWRNVDWFIYAPVYLVLYDAIYGARTMLWAGLSQEVGREDSGRYVIPWGRWHPGVRKDVEDGVKRKDEGGTGRAEEFWEWCWEQTRAFM